MKRYEVTFCKSANEKGMKFIARAVVGAKETREAVDLCFNLLSPKYREIEKDLNLSVFFDEGISFPHEVTEIELTSQELEQTIL